MKKALLILAVVLTCSLVFFGCSNQQQSVSTTTSTSSTPPAVKQIVVRLADELGASDRPSIILDELQAKITQETGGRIKFEHYTAGSLYTQADAMTALQAGNLEMGAGGAFLAFLFPELDVINNFPFLFKDMNHYERFMDTDVYKSIESRMEAKGIKPLTKAYAPGPNNFENNKRAINKMEDLVGLKFAAQPSALVIESVTMLGATPVSIPPPELPGSLETGMVDGHMGAMWPMAFLDYVKLEPYLCVAPAGWFTFGVVTSAKWWNTLPADVQQTLSTYMVNAVEQNRQLLKQDNEKYFEIYKSAPNTTVTYMSDEEMKRCLDKLSPLKDKLIKENPTVKDVFDAAAATR